jgi:magnesium-transporting ATPase (P-type)
MGLLDTIRPLVSLLPSPARRVSVHGGQAHVELRPVAPEDRVGLADRVRAELGKVPGVRAVDVNAHLASAIVTFGPKAPRPEDLSAAAQRAEAALGAQHTDFAARGAHPADQEPIGRLARELVADAAGILVGAALRASPIPASGAASNLAALLTMVAGVPRLRDAVQQSVGKLPAEHLLDVTIPLANGLGQRTLASVVDLEHRRARLAEQLARQRAFAARAADLCARPADAPTVEEPDEPRPELPPGPIEKYAESAWMVSLGAFAVSLLASRSAKSATASLLVGLPKSSRLGREAFAAHLGRALAARGLVTMAPAALRLLDRIDCMVIDAGALAPEGATLASRVGVDELLRAAREAGVRLFVAAPDAVAWMNRGVDGVVSSGDGLTAEIRRLQGEGRVVMLVTAHATPALAAADCSVGLCLAGRPTPWGAHLLARADLADIESLLAACGAARKAASQAVGMSLAAAGLGSFVSAGGFLPNTRRVMRVVNAASLLSMGNGIRLAHALSQRPVREPRDPTPWHSLDGSAALEALRATDAGLGDREARSRVRPGPPPPSPVVELIEAVTDELLNPLTPILAAGAGLSAVVGSIDDAALVASVVGLNALVGGVQRFSTERAIRELSRADAVRASVLRDGAAREVPRELLVRGDIVLLEAGDVVPADCRVLTAEALEVDASSFTGESLPVPKGAAPSDAAQVADRTSMLYEGTTIAAGRARALVVAVGDDTEARRAAAAAGPAPKRGGVEARLERLTKLTAPVAAGAGLSLVVLGALRGRPIDEVVGAGVSMAVAAVPEGLPLLATAAQLAAARRLAKAGALVRDPRALEALGRVDVVCFDKTGTITEGRLLLDSVSDGLREVPLTKLDAPLRTVLAAGLRATPIRAGHALESTDEALRAGAAQMGVHASLVAPGYRITAELPFEATRRLSATLGDTASGRIMSVKGAPEAVLARATSFRGEPLDDARREPLLRAVADLAGRGLRVLAVGERPADGMSTLGDADVGSLDVTGFLAFRDPVRRAAKRLLAELAAAEIRVVMITGDHPRTARAIADEVGMAGDVLTGAELEAEDDAALDVQLPRVSIIARATPSDKVRVVRALQRAGRVVAMAGDGTNDAPAIRLADVGIALGERSTPAARAAADLVLTDERLETLVAAIVEGRSTWSAVRDACGILVGGNVGEIGFTLGAGLVDGRPPMTPRQLLLVNLLTDVAPAMAIALRPPESSALPPREEPGQDSKLDRDIVWRAALTAGGAGTAWFIGRLTGSQARARTVGMVALVGAQLGQTLVAGNGTPAVLWTCIGSAALLGGIVQTPGVSQFFGCVPLGPVGWGTAVGASAMSTALSIVLPRAKVGFREVVATLSLPSFRSDD